MTISAVISGIVVRLQTISGLRVYSQVPDLGIIECPCAWAYAAQPTQRTLAGTHDQNIGIVVSVGGDYMEAQTAIYTYMDQAGSSSVRAAIEADRTLGGACSSLDVLEPETPQYDAGRGQFYTSWSIVVYS